MTRVSSSALLRGAVLAIAVSLILFPLTMLLLSGDIAYNLNIIFYSQRLFLIASLFVFLIFVLSKDQIRSMGWKPPDLDDTVVFAAMAFSLVFLLGFLHVNFDTLMRMEVLDVGPDSISVGFGGFLADNFDLARIEINPYEISKRIDLDPPLSGPQVLRIHGGWDGEGAFSSQVLMSVNGGPKIDISGAYAALGRADPSWMDVHLPPDTFRAGPNIVSFSSRGSSKVFISTQWVYHDSKTLDSQGKYLGQEALIYLRAPPSLPPLFQEAFRFQLILKLAAFFFLFLALFGLDALRLGWKHFRAHLILLGALSIFLILSMAIIQNLWIYISPVTASAVAIPLRSIAAVYTDFHDPAGPVIGVNDFYVRIAKSCSGIDSMGIFVLLFPVIITLNWRRWLLPLIPILFILGAAGAFMVNVLRLVIFIVIGAFYSPDLAVDMFHSNLGWILMLFYLALFNESVIRICRRRSDDVRA